MIPTCPDKESDVKDHQHLERLRNYAAHSSNTIFSILTAPRILQLYSGKVALSFVYIL